MNNTPAFQAPLHTLDSEKQTFGCRYSNPDFCSKNQLPQVCARARSDQLGFAPPHLWPSQYRKLRAEAHFKLSRTGKQQARTTTVPPATFE